VIPPETSSQMQLDDRNALQREMLNEFAGEYHRHGVLTADGYAPALVDTCPSRDVCWDRCRDRASRDADVHGLPGDDGSIFFPWIGMHYRRGGVCVAGWNLNHRGKDWFPLTAEHVIARASRAELAVGKRKVWGSLFAYRSMSAAAAAHDAVRGATPVVNRRPQELAAYFDDIARVQVVKCAPLGDRSNPSDAMNVECPPRFLLAELQILRPRVLIVFGGAAREGVLSALRTIDKAEPNWSHPTRSGYGRRESQVSWGPLDVLGMWHPTYARWPHALTALIDDLTARPLDRTRRN